MEIKINDLTIKYIDKGEKTAPAILFLHGWGCNGEVYRGITKHLSAGYRVILPDLPGFGGSDEPKEPWGVDEYADFVVKFAVQLGLDSFTLMAHSLGGRIALKLFGRDNLPFVIEKNIFTGAAGIKPPQSGKMTLRTRIYKLGRWFLSLPPLKKLFPNALESLRRRHGSTDYQAASPMMRQCLVKIVNEDLSHLIKCVSPSTLLIWGENDDSTPLSDGQRMESEMPDAGLAVIKNAGHYAFLEQPAIFMAILDAFLK